jgi:hypothetical protein
MSEHASNMDMTGVTSPEAENGEGKRKGGGSIARYPWRYSTYLTERQHCAVQAAMEIEEMDAAEVIRQCVREALAARGFYLPKGGA